MHLCSPHTCHVSLSCHSSWFDHPNNTWWGVGHKASPILCYFLPLRPEYLPQHPVLEHLHSIFLPQRDRPSFTPIKSTGKIIVPHYYYYYYYYYYYHYFISVKNASLKHTFCTRGAGVAYSVQRLCHLQNQLYRGNMELWSPLQIKFSQYTTTTSIYLGNQHSVIFHSTLKRWRQESVIR